MVKDGADHCSACGTMVKDWEFEKDRVSYRRVGILFAVLGFAACLGSIGSFIFLSKISIVPTYAVYAISIVILAVGVLFLIQGNRINSEGDS